MPLSDKLSTLQWVVDLDNDDDLICDAVIVGRFTRMSDGKSGVFFTRTVGSDVITVLGLLEAAREIQAAEPWVDPDDYDD